MRRIGLSGGAAAGIITVIVIVADVGAYYALTGSSPSTSTSQSGTVTTTTTVTVSGGGGQGGGSGGPDLVVYALVGGVMFLCFLVLWIVMRIDVAVRPTGGGGGHRRGIPAGATVWGGSPAVESVFMDQTPKAQESVIEELPPEPPRPEPVIEEPSPTLEFKLRCRRCRTRYTDDGYHQTTCPKCGYTDYPMM